MAETVEQLQAQRSALKKAMRSGALSVQHGDKRVQYRSMAEMKEALSELDSDIAAAGGAKKRKVYYVAAGRGF